MFQAVTRKIKTHEAVPCEFLECFESSTNLVGL